MLTEKYICAASLRNNWPRSCSYHYRPKMCRLKNVFLLLIVTCSISALKVMSLSIYNCPQIVVTITIKKRIAVAK